MACLGWSSNIYISYYLLYKSFPIGGGGGGGLGGLMVNDEGGWVGWVRKGQ